MHSCHKISTQTMANIPTRRHSKDEIAAMQAKKAMEMAGQPIVNPYLDKIASKPVVILGYLSAIFAPFYLLILKIIAKYQYEMLDLYLMLAGVVVAILVALFIFITRSLSRHHASFIVILTLVCSFAIVSLVKKDAYLREEVMLMFGHEPEEKSSEIDRLVEDSIRRTIEKERDTGASAPSEPVKERTSEFTAEEMAEANAAFKEMEARAAAQIQKAAQEKRQREAEQNAVQQPGE